MASVLKVSGKIEGTTRKLFLNVLAAEDGSKGFPAYLNEVNDGTKLPGHRVNIFVNGQGDNKWLSVSAPLRLRDDEGKFITKPRVNEEGSFLNDKGEVVDSADKAAQQFEYLKYDDEGEQRIVFGNIASINVKNTKADNTPTKFTMLNTKFFDDEDALEIARRTYELKAFDTDAPEYKEITEELAAMRRERGTWMTLYIDNGHEFLRDLGFEVREREAVNNEPAP